MTNAFATIIQMLARRPAAPRTNNRNAVKIGKKTIDELEKSLIFATKDAKHAKLKILHILLHFRGVLQRRFLTTFCESLNN